MARKGGNPELSKHQYTPQGPESFNTHLGLRVQKQHKELLAFLPGWPSLVREAIAKILEENQEIIEANIKAAKEAEEASTKSAKKGGRRKKKTT